MTAEEGLYDLISFIGSFVTSPLWFGLSVLQLMAIAFIIHFAIGILLGGIAPRSSFEKTSLSSSDNLLNNTLSKLDLHEHGSYTDVSSRSAFNTSSALAPKEGLINKNLKGL